MDMIKKCARCGEMVDVLLFNKHKKTNDGLNSWCKPCMNTYIKERGKTKKGLVTSMYTHQRTSSKHRDHNPPNYSLSQLKDWVFSQPNFEVLYKEWVESGYDKWNKPSCDRIDDYKPYSFSNIRLVTWRENLDNCTEAVIARKNKKSLKPVNQFNLNGEFVKRFDSIIEAALEVGANSGKIVNVCKKDRLKTAGYLWRYCDE